MGGMRNKLFSFVMQLQKLVEALGIEMGLI